MLLGGCSSVPNAINPVSWYRDISGASKNDALDQDQSNAQNLAAGGKAPYPNLGDVPNAPDSATSTIDRERLRKGLIADRTNAQYSDEQLRAGAPAPSLVAPPPPPPVTVAAAPQAAAPAAPQAPSSAASAAPAAPAPAPSSPIASAPLAAPVAPPAPATPAPAPSVASSRPPVSAAPAAAAAPAAPVPAAPPPKQAEAPTKDTAQPDEQTASAESSLQSPTIPNVPAGEAPQAPPPPPAMPPPPPSVVASIAPSRAAPAAAAPGSAAQAFSGKRRPAAASSLNVAAIAFADGSAALTTEERDRLSELAAMQHDQGGGFRVVGHAASARGEESAQQRLEGFTLALNRAKAVAQILSSEGVPSKQIAIEAAPGRAGDASIADIFFER
jgi:outer membrane protein OmpA-like peptidoglycan-associated protein